MDKESLENLIKYARPLSSNCDLAFTVELLKLYKPKSILELGAGNGDWLLFIANALQDNDIKFIGYENFSWKMDESWETSVSNLTKLIKSKLDNANLKNQIILKNINITQMDATTEYNGQLFDVVRLDCLATDESAISKVITDTMPYTHPNTIFIVDDIAVNYCPNRYFAMMHLVQQEKLKPLWFGDKEGAWVYPSFDFEKFKLSTENKLKTHWYTGDFFHYKLLGRQFDFLSTRMHHR
jgi:predicted O-methyltransferase YrrM